MAGSGAADGAAVATKGDAPGAACALFDSKAGPEN